MKNTALIVLAGGLSSRFGRTNKLLARFQGQEICRYSADYWHDRSHLSKFVIVPNGEHELATIFKRKNWTVLPNQKPEVGQSGSLRIGIQAARRVGSNTALICLADMPLVPQSHLDAISNAATSHLAVMSSSKGTLLPPAAFNEKLYDNLLRLSGDKGAKTIFLECDDRVSIELPRGTEMDIDTPEKLEALNAETKSHA